MSTRTNEDWLYELRQPEAERANVLADLREYLFRAVFIYLRDQRTDLTDYTLNQLRDMSQDFAQDALLSILDKLDKFRGDSRFTTWAYRFVINKAADELRRRRYRNISLERLSEQEAAALTAVLESGPKLDPDLATERENFIKALLQIIQTELSERQRMAVLGVHFQGSSVQEVAELLETSPNNLYKILHDARKKIKAKLLDQHLSEGDIMALFEETW